MHKEEIISIIKRLSETQSFYRRVLNHINKYDEYLDDLERMDFYDETQLRIYLEAIHFKE